MDTILAIMIVATILGGMGYVAHLFGKSKEKAWQSLAQNNNLKFEAGGFFSSRPPRVFGDYHGYTIEVDTCYENDVTYTRISLQPKLSKDNNQTELHNYVLAQTDVDSINKMLIPESPPDTQAILEAKANGQKFLYKTRGILKETKHFQETCQLLTNLANNYPLLIAIGGEIVPALQEIALDSNHKLQKVATQLLTDIAESTKSRFAHKTSHLLCPQCLLYCHSHTIRLSWAQSFTYYGCRECGQSREFAEGPVFAVLDNTMANSLHQQAERVEVNWLVYRNLFDFEAIEIRHATDEDVERFVVQVGNDTAAWRKNNYKKTPCFISRDCQLSENTTRILEETFDLR